MKRLSTKIMTIAACAAMMLTAAPLANVNTVQAAVKAQGTVNLATATKKLTIPKGKSTVITNNTLTMVKGRRYDVKFKVAGKTYKLSTLPTTVGKAKVNTTAIASIKSNLLTANKAGTTTFRIIKGGKDLVKLKVKVIDTTAHKHAWKNITKATCATKGKKLCKTCGATGTTAMSKTHSFKVTKKATCERKGVETCTVCGLQNTLPKTAHKYVTEKSTGIEGRGEQTKYGTSTICPGCRWDMTDWTMAQMNMHQSHIDAISEGKLSFDCFSAGYTGVAGVVRYEKYVKTESIATTCEYCGAFDMDKTYTKDLYYVDAKTHKKIAADEDPWYVYSYENYLKEHGFLLCPNCHDMEVMPGHTCQVCKAVAPASTNTAKKAAAKRPAVANPQDVITVPDTDTVIGNGAAITDTDVIVSENSTVSDDGAISGNEVISDNELNTEITDPIEGGDSVSGDSDDGSNIVIESTDGDDGIVIEDLDDADEDDDGQNDYDDSEGEVTEDE